MASYGYEDDSDYYEKEEEEELSPEDRAKMDEGLAAVRDILKTAPVPVNVTKKQIEEALWHYYYDLDKSVAYLTKTFKAKPTPTVAAATTKPQTKPKGKYCDSYPSHKLTAQTAPDIDPNSTPLVPLQALVARPEMQWNRKLMVQPESFASFFSDMPWLNVPQHRQTTFIRPPILIAGGLLGGAPSKLQALASRRKRKVDDKAALEPVPAKKPSGGAPGEVVGVSRVVQEVQKLSVEDKESAPPSPIAEPTANMRQELDIPDFDVAEPSVMASALFGSPKKHLLPAQESYPLPYMAVAIPAHLPPVFDFSTPSPDDIALAAQAKAGKKHAAPAKKPAIAAPTAAMHAIKIQETAPLPTSKRIEVVREWRHRPNPKKDACFVVVGHVDHGKSTMMGRLLLELGVVEERTIRKYKKESDAMGKASFAYAWVMDSGSEERERGVTIDIAAVPFETESTSFTILDAPGHADFTPNMITGATYADFAILVVDASTGAFESGLRGQTKQHTLLLRSMGVNRVIVAINKMDSAGWNRERFDEISDQVKGMMRALKFRLDKVSFIPVSGLKGDNLVTKPTDAKASWYIGSTLVEELETISYPTEESIRKPLRMELMDLTTKDFLGNLAVSGRVQQGHMQIGDAVLVQPSGERAYVRGLVVGKDDKDYIVAGQYAKVYLSHIDPMHVRIGDTICSPSEPTPCVKSFQMKGLAFESLLPSTVEVVRGRMQTGAQLRPMSLLHPRTAEVTKIHPQFVKQGQFGRFEVRFGNGTKVPLESGQRVVIRDSHGIPIVAGLLD